VAERYKSAKDYPARDADNHLQAAGPTMMTRPSLSSIRSAG
jgi:hypothetical protein